MITIEYTNEYEEPITPSQLNNLSDYNKAIKEDGQLRIIEFYIDNQLYSIEFYKYDGITINEIFARLNTNTVTVVESEPVDINHRLEKRIIYKEGVITHIGRILYLHNSIICEQKIDINPNLPIVDSSIKYLYESNSINNEIGNEKFNFRYNSDGSLKRMGGDRPYFNEYDDSIAAAEVAIRFPTLFIEHPYYANANFLP